MHLKDTMLDKKANTVRFHLHEVPRVIKSIETESRTWWPGAGAGGMGSEHCMGTGFQCGKMNEFRRRRVVVVAQHCEETKLYA